MAADELEIPPSNFGSPVSASSRRIPRRSPRFALPDGSPVSNGTDHSSQDDEIAKYRADIRKLQASEAQIKALSFNSAAILKEREEQLSKLLEVNGSLRKNLDAKAVAPVAKSDEHKSLLEEISLLESMRASHESEIKQLRALLDDECENVSTVKLNLQEERTLNESSQKEPQDLKIEKKRTFGNMKMFQKEISEKMSELRRLQAELSRRDVEEEPNGSIDNLDSLKKTISELEKESVKLQVEKNELEVNSKLTLKTTPDQSHGGDRDPDRNSNKLDEVTEEMILSMRKLEV